MEGKADSLAQVLLHNQIIHVLHLAKPDAACFAGAAISATWHEIAIPCNTGVCGTNPG